MTGLVGQELERMHRELKQRFGGPARIAVALYDDKQDLLKTFAHSTDGPSPLFLYEAKLGGVPSLSAIAERGKPRVINDLSVLETSRSQHSRKILEAGYRSNFTEALKINSRLLGFIFCDAEAPGFFTDEVVAAIREPVRTLAALLTVEMGAIKTLNGALNTAREFSRFRDQETANHLQRMSEYSRLIARSVARHFDLDEEEVEYIYRFSELHDVGKIGIPDRILLKPGRLTPEEYDDMRSHALIGKRMADLMINEFGLEQIQHTDMLKNIIYCHHERFDGSGYPRGLAGDEIPVEARIVTVADVFDALTSRRPYKAPWPHEVAFDYLQQKAGTLFDPVCVAAAFENRQAFEAFSRRYAD